MARELHLEDCGVATRTADGTSVRALQGATEMSTTSSVELVAGIMIAEVFARSRDAASVAKS